MSFAECVDAVVFEVALRGNGPQSDTPILAQAQKLAVENGHDHSEMQAAVCRKLFASGWGYNRDEQFYFPGIVNPQ